MRFLILFCFLISQSSISSQQVFSESDVFYPPLWQEVSTGNCVRNTINYDLDKDGIDEFIYITTHTTFGLYSFGGSSFAARKYNPINHEYDVIYRSNFLHSTSLSDLKIEDYNEDGVDELIVLARDHFYVYSLPSLELLACIYLPSIQYATQIEFEDVDADGIKDIVIAESGSLSILDRYSLSTKIFIDEFLINSFKIANIDLDPAIEIILNSGDVLEIGQGNIYQIEYELFTINTSTTLIEVIDIDKDSNYEVITWHYGELKAYDVENSALLYNISTPNAMREDRLIIKDINQDGNEDIIFASVDTWKNIHAYDGATGSEIISHKSETNDPTGLAVGDFDGDGVFEYITGHGCASSKEDYIVVSDFTNNDIEYNSSFTHYEYTFNQAVQNLEIKDLNNDGTDEIYCITYDGILNVFNADTRELLLRDDLFESHQELQNLEFYDYNQDGTEDLVATDNRDCVIIIDGQTYTKLSKECITDLGPAVQLINLEIVDLNKDGKMEYLASSDHEIFLIDVESFDLLWQSERIGLEPPIDFWERNYTNALFEANLDDDAALEFICVKYQVYRFENDSYHRIETEEDNYTCGSTFWDSNISDDLNIITGNLNGVLKILDGKDLELIDSLKITDVPINNIIQVDQNNDGNLEVFAITDNSLFRWSHTGKLDSMFIYGTFSGRYDAFKFYDTDDDNILELYVGGGYRIQQIDLSKLECTDFDTNVEVINPNCSDTLWTINVMANENIENLYLNSLPTSTNIHPLHSGNYSIIAENIEGCKDLYHIELKNDTFIDVLTLSFGITCDSIGSAVPNLLGGNQPFEYLWSNGDTTEILSTTDIGDYFVTVTDAHNCVITDSVTIVQNDGFISTLKSEASCSNQSQVIVYGNVFIVEVYWDGQLGEQVIQGLPSGDHIVEVIDINGCHFTEEFTLNAPELSLNADVINDCNSDSIGYIKVNPSGGVQPYSYQWSDPQYSGDELFDIPSGSYSVTVFDSQSCVGMEDFIITNIQLDTFYVDIDNDGFGTEEEEFVLSCDKPVGMVNNSSDCDDNNPDINPNEEEIPNNDIDEDCDGLVLTTSIHEIGNTTVNIYPNPARNWIFIDIDKELNYAISLLDIKGKLIKKLFNENQIELSSIESGIYLIEIKDLKSGQRVIERIFVTQ